MACFDPGDYLFIFLYFKEKYEDMYNENRVFNNIAVLRVKSYLKPNKFSLYRKKILALF